MAKRTLANRVMALEVELARLKAMIGDSGNTNEDWLGKIWGSFANDPIYDEAMRLGREYRQAQRPKPNKL
jgi:hypothetical protein